MTDSKTVAVLVRARGFVERGWCQNVSARRGLLMLRTECDPTDPHARRWCASGAIGAALGVSLDENSDVENEALDALMKVLPAGYYVGGWNDEPERKKADVLAAFDRAIELARANDVQGMDAP